MKGQRIALFAHGRHAYSVMRISPLVLVLVLSLVVALGSACARASAGTLYVDGVSDQNLPVWDGSFVSSPFAELFRDAWVPAQLALARYGLQWNAIAEKSAGPNGNGDYRERFEAWLEDVRSIGLTPLVALTSYTTAYPKSSGEYTSELERILHTASGLDNPIAYVEPWNEPNNQGKLGAAKAGEIANWANGVCGQRGCSVIAGDFEDTSTGVTAYEKTYIKTLAFSPTRWGIHPYVSVKEHSDANLVTFKTNLPSEGAGGQIWITEVGAYYCKHGVIRGEAQQASDAAYLVGTLIPDPRVAPTHVFYYGFLYGQRLQVPCTAAQGDDTELYKPTGEARSAASVIFAANPEERQLLLTAKPSEAVLLLG